MQIFERKQAYIKNLEDQLKAQEGIKTALEEAKRRELLLQQQLQEAEQTTHHILAQHQAELKAKDGELQSIKAQNDKLIKEKAHITQEHIQEAYQMNMSLHRRTMELEQALREAEQLLRARTQLVREMEEIPKIPISPDD